MNWGQILEIRYLIIHPLYQYLRKTSEGIWLINILTSRCQNSELRITSEELPSDDAINFSAFPTKNRHQNLNSVTNNRDILTTRQHRCGRTDCSRSELSADVGDKEDQIGREHQTCHRGLSSPTSVKKAKFSKI